MSSTSAHHCSATAFNAQACFRDLLRFPTLGEVSKFTGHFKTEDLTSWSLKTTAERQIAILIKDYQGIRVDTSEYTLTPDLIVAQDFMITIYDLHSRYLAKNPLRDDMIQFFAWLKLYGQGRATEMLRAWIDDQNECKYIRQCIEVFVEWGSKLPDPSTGGPGKIRVRYYGPIGTSGYAMACRDIIQCLASSSQIELTFVPCSVQNMNILDDNEGNKLLSSLLPSRDIEVLQEGGYAFPHADIVIIHAVPDMYIPIVRREKQANPGVVTVGITVWETNHVPPQWIPHLYWVDRVTFPNRWNRTVFRQDVPRLDVAYLPHPVIAPVLSGTEPEAPKLKELLALKEEIPNLYVFYTINEFSGRKGLDMLLKAYIRSFTAQDPVVLFVKTHGSVAKEVCGQLVERMQQEKVTDGAPRLILDYTRWKDDDITRLHMTGDSYVSLTKSEGQGLGACIAGLMGKNVIMTQYGGQMDYLVDIDWVSHRLHPATFCSLFDPTHHECLKLPCCRHFPFFIPAQQSWAFPDIAHARDLMVRAYQRKASGKASTVMYLQENFGQEAIRDQFITYLVETASGQGNRAIHPVQNLDDPYDQPAEFFAKQAQTLAPQDIELSLHTVKGSRPTVLCISCAGYGNFGDDLYWEVHRSMMGEEVDLVSCTTQSYLHSDGTLRHLDDFTSEDDLLPVDYVFIGGGGIINAGETRSSIFRVYFPYCRKRVIPISLVSVGCGFPVSDGHQPDLAPNTRRIWNPLLEYANLVTTRSVRDRDIIRSMMPTSRHFRIHLLPDIGYGVFQAYPQFGASSEPPISNSHSGGRSSGARKSGPRRETDSNSNALGDIIFCPTNFMSVRFPDVVDLLQRKVWEHPGSRLVFLPLDGLQAAGDYPAPFVQEETERFRALFPDAIIYQGRFFSGAFLNLLQVPQPSDSVTQTMEECLALFKKAACIITGRYHALIMAKRFGRPFEIGTANLPKLIDEADASLDINLWTRHYDLLKADIVAHYYVPYYERGILSHDPENWSESERNTTIVDVVTQSPNQVLSVPFVQTYSNVQLWNRKRNLLTDRVDVPRIARSLSIFSRRR